MGKLKWWFVLLSLGALMVMGCNKQADSGAAGTTPTPAGSPGDVGATPPGAPGAPGAPEVPGASGAPGLPPDGGAAPAPMGDAATGGAPSPSGAPQDSASNKPVETPKVTREESAAEKDTRLQAANRRAAQALFQQGKTLFKQENFPAAAKILKLGSDKDPDNRDLFMLYLTADLYAKMERNRTSPRSSEFGGGGTLNVGGGMGDMSGMPGGGGFPGSVGSPRGGGYPGTGAYSGS